MNQISSAEFESSRFPSFWSSRRKTKRSKERGPAILVPTSERESCVNLVDFSSIGRGYTVEEKQKEELISNKLKDRWSEQKINYLINPTLALFLGFFLATTTGFSTMKIGASSLCVLFTVSKSKTLCSISVTALHGSTVAFLFGLADANVLTGFLYGAFGYSAWQSVKTPKVPTMETMERCSPRFTYLLCNCSECPICLDYIQPNQERDVLPCKHEFHRKCVDRWREYHDSCPLCRRAYSG